METKQDIINDMIQKFGTAYRAFGLESLMGHIVALLLSSPQAISLDDIAERLERSKGPISQIMRRLTDHHLILKIWKPGTRRDYYQIEPNVFSNAFKNNYTLIKNNTKIANDLLSRVETLNDESLKMLQLRLVEMKRFYELMEIHYDNFLAAWSEERKIIYGEKNGTAQQ